MQNVGKTAVGDGNSASAPAISLQNAQASLSRDSKFSIDVIVVFCQLCSNCELWKMEKDLIVAILDLIVIFSRAC